MFIGKKKIESIMDKENGIDVVVSFEEENNSDITINKELLSLIQSEEEGEGNVTDNITHFFAKKFVSELAYYGLEYYFSRNIGVSMETLSHNLREELFRATFECSGGDDINLRLLLGIDKSV